MLRTGVIWKSGCWWRITSRSGWLLELLTELKTLQIILLRFDIFIGNIYPALGMIRDGTSSKSWAEYLLQSSGGVYLSTWKSSSSQFKCSINWRFQISIHLLKHYRGRLAKSIALKAHSLELCIGSLYMNAFFIHLMNSDTYPHSIPILPSILR